jgi:lipopolysaccharide heptosyltransferase II
VLRERTGCSLRERAVHAVDLGRASLARGLSIPGIARVCAMIGLISPRDDARRVLLRGLGAVLGSTRGTTSARRKILVVRPDHLGDLLMLTPALRRLRQGLPNAEIVALIGPWGRPVLERNSNLNRLITWSFPWFDRRPRRSILSPYLSLIRLARLLRAEQFDLALQFRADFWWGALAGRLAGIPEQIGFDVPTVRPFLTGVLPLYHGGHAADENLRLAAAVAGPGGGEGLEFDVREADRQRANELLGTVSGNRPLIALQSGAGAPVKRWPIERLAEVGRRLRDELGATIVALGGPDERDLVAMLAQQIGAQVVPLAGVTTLGELAAVLERCALALGPDSGPLHLAVAVGTPTIHLFGPADPRRFGPYGDPSRHRVILARWPCCPCNRLDFPSAEVPEHECMAAIPAEDVLAVARELLEESGGRAWGSRTRERRASEGKGERDGEGPRGATNRLRRGGRGLGRSARGGGSTL